VTWVRLLAAAEVAPGGPLRRVSVAELPMAVVAFRDASGQLGVLLESCPHVGTARATLGRGSVEPDGLRCSFHGWKFNVEGVCTDVPDLPKTTDFRQLPRATRLDAVEADGAIWIRV